MRGVAAAAQRRLEACSDAVAARLRASAELQDNIDARMSEQREALARVEAVVAAENYVAKARTATAAPGSASAALRGLWAYPLVQGIDGQPTPLRVANKN